jgi:hypothetical protein
MLMAICAVSLNLVTGCGFSSTIPPCRMRLKNSPLLTSAISTSKARPAVDQDPETAELHHRGGVAEANYGQ